MYMLILNGVLLVWIECCLLIEGVDVFLICPGSISLALKELREGALTTSAGREFQSVTILWLKICPLRLVLCRGLFSFSSWPLVVDSAS